MKCCQCVDRLIADGGSYPEADLPDAITTVPVVQTIGTASMVATEIVMVPVCFECRQKMLKPISKTGLVTG